ncbi:MAG: lytic transglycosylase domain-containing protein, partial [Pseudomonadota bacterium]
MILMAAAGLAACAGEPEETVSVAAPPAAAEARAEPPLHPGETAELRVLINEAADAEGVPRSLVHRVIQRESDY